MALSCHVSSDEPVIWSIVESARRTVVSGLDQTHGHEAAARRSWGAVEVQPWLGQSADPREDILFSSGEPITKKLQGQLSRARDLGFRTCLAIDQRGSSDLNFGANFMRWGHDRPAVGQTEAAAKLSFDVVVLVGNDDTDTWIRRSIGTGWLPRECAAA